MEDIVQSYPAEKIMSLILIESKAYYEAIRSNKLLSEVKEIRIRMQGLIRTLRELYPENGNAVLMG